MAVVRVRCPLTGFSGGPGVNTWFIDDAFIGGGDEPEQVGFALADLRAFYQSLRAGIQQDVTISFEPQVAVLDVPSGQVQQVITSESTPLPVNGTGTSPTSHATMVKTRLLTGVFSDGREIRGGPFIGPIGPNGIAGNGDLTSQTVTDYTAALNTLISALPIHGTSLQVYRRPRAADAGASPPVTARPGQKAAVVNAGVFPRPAVLRSRRD